MSAMTDAGTEVRTWRRDGRRGWLAGAKTLALLGVAIVVASCAPAAGTPGATSAGRSSRGGVARLGPVAASAPLTISLVLAGQAPDTLGQTLAAIEDPASPEYHHYLSPDQFAQRFGAPAASVARAESALRAGGFAILGTSPDGLLVRARGMAWQVERLFAVSLSVFRAPNGQRFYAAGAAPRIPTALAGVVTGVLGLDSLSVAHPVEARLPAALQVGSGYTPEDLAQAYDTAPLAQAGLNGANQTVAFAEIDTFRQSDIDTFDNAFNLNAPPVQVIQVGGGAAGADKVSETTLDIEVVHAVAPNAQLIAYEGGSDLQGLAQLFSQIVTDHRAHVVSISLGLCERFVLDATQAPSNIQDAFDLSGGAFFQSLDSTFREADALGMSVLVSSGDTGAYGCNQLDPSNHALSPSAPATSPYVTAVGGTALFTTASGGYDHEDGWEGALEGAGGGGGVSQVYTRPSWQTGPGVNNQFSNGMRQVPDIAADADPLTGYAIYDSSSNCAGQNCWGVVGGTSAAAPFWAGLVALADQRAAAQGKGPVGFLNPLLYRLGSGATPPYHDVVAGGNLYFPATPGWDFSTGWGSPDANAIVPMLAAGR
jgi:kumamolisin